MIPINQRNLHDPKNGVIGDCQKAAVASILELPYDAVPHFVEQSESVDDYFVRVREWCAENGMTYIWFFFAVDPRPFMADWNPDIYYIMGGMSGNGFPHSVVCKGGMMIHDPGVNKPGIVSGRISDDGEETWAVEVFGLPIMSASLATHESEICLGIKNSDVIVEWVHHPNGKQVREGLHCWHEEVEGIEANGWHSCCRCDLRWHQDEGDA